MLRKEYIPKKSKCVAICSFGDKSTIHLWTENPANFDIALCYYGPNHNYSFKKNITYTLHNKDHKFPNFVKLFTNYPELYEYDYFFFIDDDLIINAQDIQQVFYNAIKNDLDLCQPSLSKESDISHKHLTHKEGKNIERTNFVEIQAFCMSNKFLRRTFPYFFMTECGWSTDSAFHYIIRSEPFKWKFAIIHGIKMKHPYKPFSESVRSRSTNIKKIFRDQEKYIEFCFNLKFDSLFHNLIANHPIIIKVPFFSKIFLFAREIWRTIKKNQNANRDIK